MNMVLKTCFLIVALYFLVSFYQFLLLLYGWFPCLKTMPLKPFIPRQKVILFKQFSCFFIAIFFSTSFFFSHTFGLRSYINMTYPDNDSMVKKIDIANDASLFLSHNVERLYLLVKPGIPISFMIIFVKQNRRLLIIIKPIIRLLSLTFNFTIENLLTTNTKTLVIMIFLAI